MAGPFCLLEKKRGRESYLRIDSRALFFLHGSTVGSVDSQIQRVPEVSTKPRDKSGLVALSLFMANTGKLVSWKSRNDLSGMISAK